MTEYEELKNAAEWMDGGDRAIMLITSSLHHVEADGAYCDELLQLTAEMERWDMALTMAWLARIAGAALTSMAGDCREAALAEVRSIAHQLQEGRSRVVKGNDVGH